MVGRTFRHALVGFSVCLGMALTGTAPTNAGALWVYELGDCLMFNQTKYPEGNWLPYIEKLDLVKEGLDRGDLAVVRLALDSFLTMLRTRDHGIADAAAHDLYQTSLDVIAFQNGVTVGMERQVVTEPAENLRGLRTTPREGREQRP
jgi:hypothetical protein